MVSKYGGIRRIYGLHQISWVGRKGRAKSFDTRAKPAPRAEAESVTVASDEEVLDQIGLARREWQA